MSNESGEGLRFGRTGNGVEVLALVALYGPEVRKISAPEGAHYALYKIGGQAEIARGSSNVPEIQPEWELTFSERAPLKVATVELTAAPEADGASHEFRFMTAARDGMFEEYVVSAERLSGFAFELVEGPQTIEAQ